FNLMYFYEFMADQYVTFATDYHAEGFLFNRIPGVRWIISKLKWKEVFTYRLGYGTLTEANIAMNDMRQFVPTDVLNHEKFLEVKAPDRQPYMEAGVGIENILKFMRFDLVWRLNYHNPVAPERLRNFYYNFGFRVYVGIAL
ncbi:MAG: hypothetical protein NZ576_11925, partial [Bacteroidia bacterium]|nr:hypothetical protein [Bacteroidia bacterium]